ncbi:pyruvate kinase-like protein [Aspergillus insuetus]
MTPSIDLFPIPILPPTTQREIRTYKLRPFGPVLSGIDKRTRTGRLYVSHLGLPDDEHDLKFHGGIDKAIHQYCSTNYAFWTELFASSLTDEPCFKLNQHFGIKNFAPRTHQEAKTGWYYWVKEEGWIEKGMEMRVVQRRYPRWSISRLHHYVHRDKEDMAVAQDLMGIEKMGAECKDVFI